MEFPSTNKHPQKLDEKFGESAKVLEEYLLKIDWRVFFRYFCAFWGILLFSVFSLIVTVEFALWIF